MHCALWVDRVAERWQIRSVKSAAGQILIRMNQIRCTVGSSDIRLLRLDSTRLTRLWVGGGWTVGGGSLSSLTPMPFQTPCPPLETVGLHSDTSPQVQTKNIHFICFPPVSVSCCVFGEPTIHSRSIDNCVPPPSTDHFSSHSPPHLFVACQSPHFKSPPPP